MVKVADKYFKVDAWKIIEEEWDADYSQVAESVFSLGNEYMGVRGFFEEGYSGKKLIGSYFNGVYAGEKYAEGGYKGYTHDTEFMVNAVNWLTTKIQLDSERLDLKVSAIEEFKRTLDLKNGLLSRSFVWTTHSGKKTRLLFERFLSMKRMHVGVQRISLIPLNYSGNIEINMESDFGEEQQMYRKNYWSVLDKDSESGFFEIEAEVIGTKKYLYSGSRFCCACEYEELNYRGRNKIGKQFIVKGKQEETAVITRIVWNDREKDIDECTKRTEGLTYEGLLQETTDWWTNIWKSSDIEIDGDEENQQGIRYCIFQMMQTYHGAQPGNNIGAKGLTGEVYNGNAFWDTEMYGLPFFLFNNIDAAKNLLLFRYKTLDEARKRAQELDCKGAFYPVATISGKECCNLWQHASLQLQTSTAVAYGIWFYEKMTNDVLFLQEYGTEMLIEVCRMLATRGDWSADGTTYGYYCVMGPDEFQMMVNHNCYTNLMAKFTFLYTVNVLEKWKERNMLSYQKHAQRLGLAEEELADWRKKAEHMLIPKDEEKHIYEQHDGFFKLPHIEIDKIPVEEFPLYYHWSYDRIFRNDMIKQPDVLMFMLLFNHAFSNEELRANYEYYEPKCIHESSLSPSVHSILASQLGKKEEAYSFFQFATRMDLDNYNRNTEEGLHVTSIAAAWMNIIYGFGGMRSDGDILTFAPTIPKNWNRYTFHVTYQGTVIQVTVGKEQVRIRLLQDKEIKVKIYSQEYNLTKQEVEIEIPEKWR